VCLIREGAGFAGSDRKLLPLSLTPHNNSRGQGKTMRSICTSLMHPADGEVGVVLGQFSFSLCARMCLACAFDLIRPSMHSGH
jgi:hypothetical protein